MRSCLVHGLYTQMPPCRLGFVFEHLFRSTTIGRDCSEPLLFGSPRKESGNLAALVRTISELIVVSRYQAWVYPRLINIG